MKTLAEMNDQERLEVVRALIDGRLESYWNGMTHATCAINAYAEYRIKPKPPEPLQIPWDAIDDKWRWAAADKDGAIWVYEDKPTAEGEEWRDDDGYFKRIDNILKNVKRGTINWDQSLIKRPD